MPSPLPQKDVDSEVAALTESEKRAVAHTREMTKRTREIDQAINEERMEFFQQAIEYSQMAAMQAAQAAAASEEARRQIEVQLLDHKAAMHAYNLNARRVLAANPPQLALTATPSSGKRTSQTIKELSSVVEGLGEAMDENTYHLRKMDDRVGSLTPRSRPQSPRPSLQFSPRQSSVSPTSLYHRASRPQLDPYSSPRCSSPRRDPYSPRSPSFFAGPAIR